MPDNPLIQRPFASSGDALGGAGASAQRRKFLRGLRPQATKCIDDIEWVMEKAYVGLPQESGANTTLYNVGSGLKLNGDAAVDTGSRDDSGPFKRSDGSIGIKLGLCATAEVESNWTAPRAFAPRAGKKIRTFFRGTMSIVAETDFLWGLASDGDDQFVLINPSGALPPEDGGAGDGAEGITDGVVFHRLDTTPANKIYLSLVASGTPIAPLNPLVITLGGNIVAGTLFELGIIIDGTGAIEYYACHDYSKPELGVFGRAENATIAAVLAAQLITGPSFAANPTSTNGNYGDADVWWCGLTS